LRAFKAIFAIALLALPLSSARADDDENVIYETKTPYVEIDVRIQKSLAAWPALYQKLAADGRKFGTESKSETLAQWREDKSLFRGLAYSFSQVYRLRTAAGKYVSVIIDQSMFTGGAHPNHGSTTLLWDREKNAEADFEKLFKDTADNSSDMKTLSELVLDALAAEKKARDVPFDRSDMWFKDWKPEFSQFGSPSLAPSTEAGKSSGVTFHFSPYAVGAYAEGDYTAFVPAPKLMPLLTPEAQKLFGGERPESDKEQN
jgi:hypothetical protein